MKEKLDKSSSVNAKISIEVPSEKVNEHLEAYYSSVAKHAKIQGFRKGKAPLTVVKKLFSEDAGSYISERLVSEALTEAIRKYQLHIILPPRLLAMDSPTENQPFRFEAELDLKPQVPTIDCSQIEIEVSAPKSVSDQDVEMEMKNILEEFAEYQPLASDQIREARPDDAVSVRYEAKHDGQKVEKASTERQQLILGRSQVLEDFEKAIPGMKPGEKKSLEIKFGDQHPIQEIRGKTLQFELELLEILEKKLPEWTDEFVKNVDPAANGLEDFKNKLKSNLEDSLKFKAEKEKRDAIGKALVEKYPFEISARQKQMTAESLLRDSIQNLIRMGLTEDQIKSQQQELLNEAAKSAEHQIRLAYILDQIARQENIEVSDEDIEKRLQTTAERTGYSLAEIKAYYSKKEDNESVSRMERLKMDIRDEKSLDYALSKARIKIKD